MELVMHNRLHSPLLLLLAPILMLSVSSCSSSSMMATSGTRQLQSIFVSPQSATAQNFTKKQVQFTAMGSYNMSPMTGVPQQLTWSVSDPSNMMMAPSGVMIDANGMATCITFTGTVTVQASAPMMPGMSISDMGMGMGMTSSNVTGMATLTCP